MLLLAFYREGGKTLISDIISDVDFVDGYKLGNLKWIVSGTTDTYVLETTADTTGYLIYNVFKLNFAAGVHSRKIITINVEYPQPMDICCTDYTFYISPSIYSINAYNAHTDQFLYRYNDLKPFHEIVAFDDTFCTIKCQVNYAIYRLYDANNGVLLLTHNISGGHNNSTSMQHTTCIYQFNAGDNGRMLDLRANTVDTLAPSPFTDTSVVTSKVINEHTIALYGRMKLCDEHRQVMLYDTRADAYFNMCTPIHIPRNVIDYVFFNI